MLAGLLGPGGELVDKEEVIASALAAGEFDGYPASIVIQMLDVRDIKRPTASQLASQTWRRMVLERLVKYYAWGSSLIPLVRGTLVHNGLEAVGFPPSEEVITELRVTRTVPGTDIILSGQADLYFPGRSRLEDYKTCQNIPDMIREAHILQLLVYTWLLRWEGYSVTEAVIDYISWNSMRQVWLTELPNGSYGPISSHPWFEDENAFIEEVRYRYEVLLAGFQDGIVPSMEHCNTSWCYNCPVKWACDQVAPSGGTIRMGELDQHDYSS